MKKKIICIQMDIVFGNPEANYIKAEKLIAEASKQGADIAVLPELWTTGYDLTRISDLAETNCSTTKKHLSNWAKKYHIHLVGGSVINKFNDKCYNTLLIINNEGEFVKQYSKLHLFKLMNEHHHLTGGHEDGLFVLDDLPSAGLICYDIRFPEWVRKHALLGAQILYVSAEWPFARLDHWRTLLIARAIENQSYVVACNRVGADPDNVFAGHSLIIDPWGKIISEGNEQETLISGIIDTSLVSEVRAKIPVTSDRLPTFYK